MTEVISTLAVICLRWLRQASVLGAQTSLCPGVLRQASVLGCSDKPLSWGAQTSLCTGVLRQASVLGCSDKPLYWGAFMYRILLLSRCSYEWMTLVLNWSTRASSS